MDAASAQHPFERAVAHFNARRFWEAHEDWEALWHEAEGDERLWLQGLIQYAAAFFHYERGFHATGFVKLMRGAHAKTRAYRGPERGIDWPRLVDDLAPWREHAEAVARGRDLRERAPGAPPRIHPRAPTG